MNNESSPFENEYWEDPLADMSGAPAEPAEAASEEAPAEKTGGRGKKKPSRLKPKAKKKKKHHPIRTLFIILAILVFLGGVGVGIWMFIPEVRMLPVFSVFSDVDGERSEEAAPTESAAVETAADASETEEAQCYLEQGPLTDDFRLELVSCEGLDQLSYEEIYAENINSVVSIRNFVELESGSYYTGTGIVLSSDGYILTNEHVIEDSLECYVTLQNDSTYSATLVGMDAQSDLAVLKIEAKGLTPAVFADSSELVVGNGCVAIGNPLGEELRGTMTTGIISAMNRNITYNGGVMTLIQTDCSLNSGNSGGPLINMYGQVIGVCNMKMMSSVTTVEGIGFAIPTATVQNIVNKLLSGGEVVRAMLGLTAYALNSSECFHYGIDGGLCVAAVDARSDAFAQGIRVDDIIVAVDGITFSSVSELNAYKQDMAPGDTLNITILRDGETFDVTVKLMNQADLQ